MPTEDFIEQPPSSTIIWRYMNFDKFASLLTTASLFFCQVKRFDDRNEGSMQMVGFDDIGGTELETLLTQIYDAPNGWRSYVAANCWHMNEHESLAMWKLYLENNRGIAIQSSVGRLNESLLNINSFGPYYSGAITYKKGEASPAPGDPNGLDVVRIALFRKMPTHAYESEYRVIVYCRDLQQINYSGGIFVAADLNKLIEKIYVAPGQPTYVQNLIENLLNKCNLSVEVISSELDTKPKF